MVFHSYKFILLFLPAVLLCYRLAERFEGEARVRVRSLLLRAASIVFIAGYGWQCLLAVCCSLVVNGLAARFFLRDFAGKTTDGHPAENAPVSGRGVVPACIIILNLCVLCFFKLTAFPIPVGLSFYTFTQIAFLVDAYRGEIASFTISEYLLHVLFFPKFLQGPILRMEDTRDRILSRLADPLTARGLLNGALLFSLGLAKKTLIADTLANCVDTAYGILPHLTRADAVITILAFMAQLYFDFSAYCDMGMGCAWMMGLDLTDNFRQPLRATNIVSYWKNWHMSLTGFFTRYLYIPLGGSRKGNARRYLNILIVFLVSGFWHGTGVTFLIWGALHGVAYAAVTAVTGEGRHKARPVMSSHDGVRTDGQTGADRNRYGVNRKENRTLERDAEASGRRKPVKIVQTAVNFIFVSVCYVFFRAPSVSDALTLLERTYGAAVSYVSETIADTFYMDEIWYVVKVLPLADWEYRKYLCMAVVLVLGAVFLFVTPDAKTLVLRNDAFIRQTAENGSGKLPVRCVLFVLLCAALFVWALLSTGGVATYLYVNF